ncbi:MAG: ferrous iron transport protein B [bacterium]|nr:ferrous iron transport protein B [bacterium]
MNEELNVGFIGNPNCGKTTLFNAYTGAKLKVANWPGVTVEKKEGAMKYHDHHFKLVDLPGIYSLTSYTMEEKLSREYIMSDQVDVIVDIADASSLERNLYLTLQLIELGKPVILALNMMDIVEERGMEIDLHRMPEMLGIPVIPVSARKKTGLDILMHTVAHHKKKIQQYSFEHHHAHLVNSSDKRNKHDQFVVVYSDEIEHKIDELVILLKNQRPDLVNARWHAIKLLEQDEEVTRQVGLDISHIVDRSYEQDIINQKYDFIDEVIEECLVNKAVKEAKTDKIDAVLTNRYAGIPIFLGIMAMVFFLTFTVGDFLKGYFEIFLEHFSGGAANVLSNIGAGEMVSSLIVDGIIAGVGGILTFLPNIFILFLALAILEDSGYMSRVAYIMDGLMGKLGLSGRAFIPMLLGFGCSVPAVMASRALEDIKDRRKTVLVTPFMSCSARLPIYVLFSEIFFPDHAMLVAYSMYVIGLVVAITIALILKLFEGKKGVHTLLIELPEYKTPNAHTIFIYVWEKVKDYLTKAGTTIFVASIVVWFVLNFGPNGMVGDDVSGSFGAAIGKFLIPVLAPAGIGVWQIGVCLISGLAAKEVVVSSFCVLFGISNINSSVGMMELKANLSVVSFGPANAYALMLFCLLYTPCIATLATVKRELNSTKWMIASVVLQLSVAWGVATLFYQIASRVF